MVRVFRQYIALRRIVFVIGEGVLIFLAVTLASYLVMGNIIAFEVLLITMWPKMILVSITTQLSLYFNDLYELDISTSAIDMALRLIQSIGITSIVLSIVYFLWPDTNIGKWFFFTNLMFLLFFLVFWRFVYNQVLKKKLFVEKAIILGSGNLAKDILTEVSKRQDFSYNIHSLVVQDEDEFNDIDLKGIPVQYGFENISDFADPAIIDHLIVALDEKRGIFPYKKLLECKIKGINIIDGVSFYERITGKLLVERINPSWLIFSDGFIQSKITKALKRVSDLLFSGLMLLLLSPFLLLTAIFIKIESNGPILFAQERVGEYGKPFILYKFRSMKVGAEELTGPVWATEDDPRVTRIGRILRDLRIDEFPQLWNVFIGDMSFVGPRPEREFFVNDLAKKIPYYNDRFSVKPGVTGWAQIKYPYGASEKDALEKLKYDLYYMKNMSYLMDMIVFFHTAKVMLLGRGSR